MSKEVAGDRGKTLGPLISRLMRSPHIYHYEGTLFNTCIHRVVRQGIGWVAYQIIGGSRQDAHIQSIVNNGQVNGGELK